MSILHDIVGRALQEASHRRMTTIGERDAVCAEIEQHYKPRIFSDAIAQEDEEGDLNNPEFLGKKGYDKKQDQERLGKQLRVVFGYMLDEQWHTQQEVADGSGACITSLRARFSDLRSKRWGEHRVDAERRKEGKGTWYYRLTPNRDSKTYTNYLIDRARDRATRDGIRRTQEGGNTSERPETASAQTNAPQTICEAPRASDIDCKIGHDQQYSLTHA